MLPFVHSQLLMSMLAGTAQLKEIEVKKRLSLIPLQLNTLCRRH